MGGVLSPSHHLLISLCTDFLKHAYAGSNTHNNGNPAGDGQAGDTGEGTTGERLSVICRNIMTPLLYFGFYKFPVFDQNIL